MSKTAFKYDTELKAEYVAEVKEEGVYQGEPCINIIMRESFHTIGRFGAMLPSVELIEKCGGSYENKN